MSGGASGRRTWALLGLLTSAQLGRVAERGPRPGNAINQGQEVALKALRELLRRAVPLVLGA